jgi:hypothetical protein
MDFVPMDFVPECRRSFFQLVKTIFPLYKPTSDTDEVILEVIYERRKG